jgi:MFS family permease
MAIASPSAAPAPPTSSAAAWRWVHVGVAALAMVCTLPGRTQGLGLFTEPLLKSLDLDRTSYGFMNTWATLIGALFCLPCGWLLDKFGTRVVLFGVTTALGATVLAMSEWTAATPAFTLPSFSADSSQLVIVVGLFVFLVLTRGLGQSALSVVSLALIGRSAGRKPGTAMGVFAVATAIGFIAAVRTIGRPDDWRPAWAWVGVAVLIGGWIGSLLVWNRFLDADPASSAQQSDLEISFTLGQALRSSTFWTFSITTSFLGLVLAGTSLFGESLIAERGLTESIFTEAAYAARGAQSPWWAGALTNMVFVNVAIVGIPFGLMSNLTVGWLATKLPLGPLMGVATCLFAVALALFPEVSTEGEVYAYAALLSASGGGITVCFYTVYRRAFGPAHLGSIQGVAQMLTVLFSAAGPQIFATVKERSGSYTPLFYVFANTALTLAIVTWVVGLPARQNEKA